MQNSTAIHGMTLVVTIPRITIERALSRNKWGSIWNLHTRRLHGVKLLSILSCISVVACSDGGVDGESVVLPTAAPTQISMVAAGEFVSPMDAVSSPDGTVFYFTAFTNERKDEAAIYRVPSEGGATEILTRGYSLENPTGLLMSCDGSTLYVADMSFDDDPDTDTNEAGALYSLTLDSTNTLSKLDQNGIAVPSGLAMNTDCSTMRVTGTDSQGTPILFSLPLEGGTADTVYSGDPLVSPTGVYVDTDDVTWVTDHLDNEDGLGVLFAISNDGEASAVLSGIRPGVPGGVTLAAGGVTAVIPELDEFGNAQLLSVNTQTRESSILATPEIVAPAGIRSARNAGVFVIVDQGGNAIFRAE